MKLIIVSFKWISRNFLLFNNIVLRYREQQLLTTLAFIIVRYTCQNLNLNTVLVSHSSLFYLKGHEHFMLVQMVHFIFRWMKIFVPLHAWKNIHYLFYETCTKIQVLKQIGKKKHWKAILAQAKHFTSCVSNLSGKYYANACVTLNTRTAFVTFAPRVVFLISLVLEQMSEDCIGNTEHSNNCKWWVQ